MYTDFVLPGRALIAFHLVGIGAVAATLVVQTAPCRDRAHCFAPATPAQFLAAFKAAACGDTIQIAANTDIRFRSSADELVLSKDCGANPITITTTTDPSWLPDARARILPSYRSLIPRFTLDAVPDQPMDAVLVFNGKGIRFDNVGFWMTPNFSANPAGYLYWLKFGRDAMAGNVTLNHTLFYSPSYKSSQWLMSVITTTAEGVTWTDNFNFTNSYVGGVMGAPQGTSQGMSDPNVVKAMAGKDWRLSNNLWCCGFTEFFISGGNPFSTSAGNPMLRGLAFEHNIGLNALHFMSTTPNFVGVKNRPTMKNFFELKNGENATVRWNTFENQWNDTGASQWWAVKLAQYTESSGRHSWQLGCPHGGATLSAGDNGPNTKVTISGCGNNRNPYILPGNHTGAWIGIAKTPNADDSMYLSDGNTAWEWRVITRIERNPSRCTEGQPDCSYVAQVDAPYTKSHTTVNARFAMVANPWTTVRNVKISGNVWHNVASGFAYEGNDPSWCYVNPAVPGGCASIQGVEYHDNVMIYDSPYADFSAVGFGAFMFMLSHGGADLKLEHNTAVRMPTAHPNARMNAMLRFEPDRGPFESLTIQDNLAAPASNAIPGPVFARGMGKGSKITHNSYIGTPGNANGANQFSMNSSECRGRVCQPNYFSDGNASNIDYRFVDAAANDFRIRPDDAKICQVQSTSPLTIRTCEPHRFLPGQAVRLDDIAESGLKIDELPCDKSDDGRNCWAGYARVFAVPDNTHLILYNWTDNPLSARGKWKSGGVVRFALSKGGHDGKDVGADMDEVALIQYLEVKPASKFAAFSWKLPKAMAGQVCQLEVSPDKGLLGDDGDYTVIASLNPAFFKRADHDESNSRAKISDDRQTRTFQAGADEDAAGDDGQQHDLRLAPGTDYYYRLTCGGAIARNRFKTLP